jgi:hypothetical protein
MLYVITAVVAEEAGSVLGYQCLDSFETCFSFSALANQYDHFMITNQNTSDKFLLCTVLFQAAVTLCCFKFL